MANLNYKAIKVSRKVAKAAKERGFEVVRGNYIIGPNERTFKKRLQEGQLTGVKPVKGGYMEEVVLPHTVFDMRSLVAQLEEGIDTLKLDNEQFAFKFYGHESYRAFMNTEQLLNYLRSYKSMFDVGGSMKAEDLTEEFENLVILRLHRNDTRRLIPSKDLRKKQRRGRPNATGRSGSNRRSLAEKLAQIHPAEANRIRKKRAEKARLQREEMRTKDPVGYKAYKEAARKRAHKYYHGE